jgi:glucan phosphoethanolaminetransferase (alkaline phosphatase superfamily)
MTDQLHNQDKNRRKTPRSHDKFYQIVLGLNIVAWVVFVAALVVFHYARPELISGVQEYWGVVGRQDWAKSLSFYLLLLLGLCTILSLALLFLRKLRTRRQSDYFGINVVILLVITVTVLVWIIVDLKT